MNSVQALQGLPRLLQDWRLAIERVDYDGILQLGVFPRESLPPDGPNPLPQIRLVLVAFCLG